MRKDCIDLNVRTVILDIELYMRWHLPTCNPSLVIVGTALPMYNTRQRQRGTAAGRVERFGSRVSTSIQEAKEWNNHCSELSISKRIDNRTEEKKRYFDITGRN